MAKVSEIKKGDRVKVAFEGVVTYKDTYGGDEFIVLADDQREVEYLRAAYLTRVIPDAPPKGSAVKTSKGVWVHLGGGVDESGTWYLLNKKPGLSNWDAAARPWDEVYEPGYLVFS